eukprot:CAMPEP_0172465464 /NCGR_PEP_ID=MMETSP1065-20121228/53586_1 /TAXON_ID=265537 /ORGANISM="Amphiprora paludosa, Strain CCMP125" /LENGTH=49 /DNA_ID= /DNA_START= /DNA_END= /DNA_ORIENTATION=
MGKKSRRGQSRAGNKSKKSASATARRLKAGLGEASSFASDALSINSADV